MENPKIKFYADKKSFWAHSASVLLVLAIVFQVIGSWGLWTDRFFAVTQILLPVLSFFLFVLLLSLLGEKALWLTALPFLGGLAFYGVQAWYEENRIAMVIGIAFCVLAAVLYLGTVFSLIRTKWLLALLFVIPLAYRAFYRDVRLLQNLAEPVPFAAGMREMGLLCVLLAMTMLAIGMKKRVRERRKKEAEPQSEGPVSTPAAAPDPAPAPEPEPVPEIPVPNNEEPESSDTDGDL